MDEKESVPLLIRQAMPRRQFLRTSVAATGGAIALGLAYPLQGMAAGHPLSPLLARWLSQSPVATPEELENYLPVNLTQSELSTLKAIMARLIPNDDLGPGAVESGAFIFVDRELGGYLSPLLATYQTGLKALDTAAGSGGFATVDATLQDSLLSQAQTDDILDLPAGFFALMLEHTRQGMFADPMYGGNIGFAGWDLIGYPGIKLVWTADEQQVNATVTPEHKSVAEFGGQAS